MSLSQLEAWGEPPPDDFDVLETVGYTFTRGGSFILDTPADPEPVWGTVRTCSWPRVRR